MVKVTKSLIFLFSAQIMVMGCSHTKYGTLTINAIPWGEVYIDRKKADQDGSETPIINYPISSGEHVIEVMRKGFTSYKKNIRVIDGEHQTISANLSILFNKDNFDFHLIYGMEDIKKMQKVAIVIGPEILEETLYKDIVKYVRGFGEVNTVLLYSYQKGIEEIGTELRRNIGKLLKYSKNLNISYFNRYMKYEEEIDELRRIMEPYETEKKAEHKGSCVFEQP